MKVVDGMKLSQFDGNIVKITLDDGTVFEGKCSEYNAEYCMAEFGREEDALQIDDWLFFESDIADIELSHEKSEYIWLGKTEHCMKLTPDAFRMIENGLKTVELRLYDEKRQKIKAGDIIRFENTDDDEDVIHTEVLELYIFDSFKELYAKLPLLDCGYTKQNIDCASPEDMDKYYSREEQEKYKAVGIRLELI